MSTAAATIPLATHNCINNNHDDNKFLIITPAVSIDRGYQGRRTGNDLYVHAQSNRGLVTKRQTTMNLLPTTTSACMSWRWCAVFCAAVRCFGNVNTPKCTYGFRTSTRTILTTANCECNLMENGNGTECDKNRNVIYEL